MGDFLGCGGLLASPAILLVAENNEISNLDLIKDISRIIKLVKDLNIGEGSAC